MLQREIAVFYHVYCTGYWEDLYKEQLQKLIDSKLIENAKLIYISVIGNSYEYSVARSLVTQYPNVTIELNPANNYEYTTLRQLKRYCDINDAFVLYMHTKGVSANERTNENQTAWREFMEYFNIENWNNCVEMLAEGYDCCGVNWWGDHENPHFSGNFWWASSDYIKKLQLPLSPSILSKLDGSFNRVYYEFWVGKAKPKAYSFCNNGKAFYTTKIERKDYVS